jgi:LemA protein
MEAILLVIVIIVVIAIGLILTYNRLVALKARVENAWSQVDVQTKRRFDLIPNLVEVVKGYAKHEKEVFTQVTAARSAIMSAKTIGDKAKAENQLTGALKSLFAVAENYPQLKASENFMQLQEEVSGTESKIAYSRQFYNDSVMEYNQSIKMFPTNVVAGMLGFTDKQYFETPDAERQPVKIKF